MKIAVLGAGLVGCAIIHDLASDKDYTVIAADVDQSRLNHLPDKVEKNNVDVTRKENLESLIDDVDMVVNAVPGSMGFNVLKNVIESGKDVVDIAFFPEDMYELNDLAVEKGVTVVCDMGIAPGMSNILAAKSARELDKVENVMIYVGGLPTVRKKPYEYKAPFSPADVIEEYIRPARVKEHANVITKSPLTDYELIDFDNVGTLEAFNTDGLRSLLDYIPAVNMKEKTLRYPGYAEKIQLLKDSGFFDEKPLTIEGKTITPLEFTSQLLFPLWKLEQGEKDLTVLRIIVEGLDAGSFKRLQWDLYDEYDARTGFHSMARTTGYSATSAVRLLASGAFKRRGISAPEILAEDEQNVKRLLDELAAKDVMFRKQTT
ncbi:MAG: saccharopine dehydrogenase NADP-binding domain-containing protein [Bacteroidales bacterium]|nr:saccharopine dehydrogenase NADP-binding domain-containing protein [Bacteroidales bacterium]MCF8337490.1 saccharopine dehydrogenase NADP-binding domain-containing protein [Bacteroidales bacterium]